EELRAFPEGSDEKRFDSSGDSSDDEIHGDLREEHAEAECAHEEHGEEACAAREHPGAEPVPWKPSDECPETLPSLGHTRATTGRSLEPMPQAAIRDQSFISPAARRRIDLLRR